MPDENDNIVFIGSKTKTVKTSKLFTKYTVEQYNKVIELNKLGYGSLRITKILGIQERNTIEGWINQGRKPYYFSEKRIAACNSKENVERMRAMNKTTQPKAVQISAELRTKKLPEKAQTLSKELAYIMGVIKGDGHASVKQRRIILSATDQDFVSEFKNNLENWCGFRVRFYSKYIKPSGNVKTRKLQYVAYVDSKEAAQFLKHFDANLLLGASVETQHAFIRGLFDSESYVIPDDVGIICYNTNKGTIMLAKTILEYLSIKPTITVSHTKSGLPYYHLNIYRQDSILNYSKIGYSIQRKQDMLEQQTHYIKGRKEQRKMEEHTQEDNIVFIGPKPFMKFSQV